MKRDILKSHSEGSNYLLIISNKTYSKLLAIQDYPERKYYFKNEEVSVEKLVTELDNISSSSKVYSDEDISNIVNKVLAEEYSDFTANAWHYEREYRMLVKAMTLLKNK